MRQHTKEVNRFQSSCGKVLIVEERKLKVEFVEVSNFDPLSLPQIIKCFACATNKFKCRRTAKMAVDCVVKPLLMFEIVLKNNSTCCIKF